MLQIQDCNGILQEPIGKVNGVVVVHEKPQKRNLGKIPNSTSGKKSKEAAVLHALAEKGRRKRINEHLQTLRLLFPELAKKQKASVLTEAVQRLKELKKKVAEHVPILENEGEGINNNNGRWPLFLPGEKDEVKVVDYSCESVDEEQITQVKATICCEDRQRLNADLTEAVKSVKGRLVKAEMSTIGGRTKAVLVVQLRREGGGGGGEEDLRSLRMALKAVVEDRALTCPLLLGSKPIDFENGPNWTINHLPDCGSDFDYQPIKE